jgi:hypothetical protein
MTLDELYAQALAEGAVVTADQLRKGEIGVFWDWDTGGGREPLTGRRGALVVRVVRSGMDTLVTIHPSPNGQPVVGDYWSRASFAGITVIRVKPELPYEVQP